MTDLATIALRPAGPADAESIAALFTDEGYPAGPSDIVARLERFATLRAERSKQHRRPASRAAWCRIG